MPKNPQNRQHQKNAVNTNTQGHRFNARTVNLININFTHEETLY
jgi:hypothetical protein